MVADPRLPRRGVVERCVNRQRERDGDVARVREARDGRGFGFGEPGKAIASGVHVFLK
jgi:hypothetical protein